MTVVERPPLPESPVPRSRIWDGSATCLHEIPPAVFDDAEACGSEMNDCLRLIALATIPDLGKSVGIARRAAAVGAREGLGLFTAATLEPGKPFSLTVPGLGTHALKGTGPSSMADAPTFADCFALALIARDSEALDGLSSFDRRVLRQSITTAAETAHVLADCLVYHYKRDSKLRSSLKELAKLTSPRAQKEDPEFSDLQVALGSLAPIITHTVWPDNDRFNAAVVAALEAHRTWYVRHEEGLGYEEIVAVHVLGLVCLAHERGLSVNVRSPYLPIGLVDPSIPDDQPLAPQ